MVLTAVVPTADLTAVTGGQWKANTESTEWQDVDMTKFIKEVEVEIGGQKIDKHYSQWLDIYNELFETSHDLRMIWQMVQIYLLLMLVLQITFHYVSGLIEILVFFYH